MSADDAAMEKDAMTESEKPKPPRRALGRGLSALLGEAVQEEVPVAADGTPAATGSAAGSIQTIDISRIKPHPGQPRRHFDDAALQELADSIALRGVVQPILVRPLGNGYQIVAGERRWRAAHGGAGGGGGRRPDGADARARASRAPGERAGDGGVDEQGGHG